MPSLMLETSDKIVIINRLVFCFHGISLVEETNINPIIAKNFLGCVAKIGTSVVKKIIL